MDSVQKCDSYNIHFIGEGVRENTAKYRVEEGIIDCIILTSHVTP
jgi:hypothetical protein